MTSIEDILSMVRLPEDTISLCLRGDLVSKFEELEAKHAVADKRNPSLGERSPRLLLAQRMEELREEMEASTVTFRFRALPGNAWPGFWSNRPQQTENESKEDFQVRWSVWLTELVSVSAIDPEMKPSQVAELSEKLSGRQWTDLANTCFNLNQDRVQVPFSAAASATIAQSEQT